MLTNSRDLNTIKLCHGLLCQPYSIIHKSYLYPLRIALHGED